METRLSWDDLIREARSPLGSPGDRPPLILMRDHERRINGSADKGSATGGGEKGRGDA
jgi:hypothetical protein